MIPNAARRPPTETTCLMTEMFAQLPISIPRSLPPIRPLPSPSRRPARPTVHFRPLPPVGLPSILEATLRPSSRRSPIGPLASRLHPSQSMTAQQTKGNPNCGDCSGSGRFHASLGGGRCGCTYDVVDESDLSPANRRAYLEGRPLDFGDHDLRDKTTRED